MEQKADRTFLSALAKFPDAYARGHYNKRVWGATVKRSIDGKRVWLFAEDLEGSDVVSFNLYRLESGIEELRPCEMSSAKVVAFVLGFSAT